MNIADKPRRGCRLPISKSDWERFSNDTVFAKAGTKQNKGKQREKQSTKTKGSQKTKGSDSID